MIKYGDKVKGFKFSNENSARVVYVTEMDNYVGKSGVVRGIGRDKGW